MKRLSLLLLFSVFAMGCNSSLDGLPGHYEGSLFTRVDGKGTQTPVKAEITVDGNGAGRVALSGIDGKAVLALSLTGIRSDGFSLAIPEILSHPTALKEKDGCFLASGATSLRFCVANNEVVLEVATQDAGQIFTLSLDRFRKVAELPVEPPQDFTIAQALDHAFKRNFDNRSEWENVLQARYTRNFTRLNLLPGVSFASVEAVAVVDMAGIIGSIGDFAPFLLPTRWFQMAEAGHRLAAEEDALILLRAVTAVQVEGFAYAIARDEAIYKFYQDTLDQAQTLLNQVLAREDLGLLPTGVGDDAMAVVSGINQVLLTQELALQEDYSSLAQTMGFYSPSAVKSIALEPVEQDPIDAAPALDLKTLVKNAEALSFELRQTDSLIKVAKFQKLERYFNWLDPVADYQGKIGVGLGEYIKVGASQENQLWDKYDSIRADISTRATNAYNERANALKMWTLVDQNMAIQSRRMSRIMSAAQFGTTGDLANMTQIFQDYLSAEVAQQTTIAAYRVARTKIDRFLLQGHYKGLAQLAPPDGPESRNGRRGD